MANPVCEVLLTRERLEAPKAIVDLTVGAIVDFFGVVRELEEGRGIEGIDYEAHETMARHQLEKIAQRAASDFVMDLVVIHHRIGFVPAGECSLFVRAAGERRAAAFSASEWIVDELKLRVPIWKRARFKIDNQPEKKTGFAAETASIPSRA